MAAITPIELHIALRDAVQKISSAQIEDFYPEELDYHLNRAQDSFIDSLTDEDFSDPIIRNAYFQNLIIRNKQLKAFIPTQDDDYFEEDVVVGILPPDYIYHVASRAGVQDVCNYTDTLTKENIDDSIITIEFPISTRSSGPYYVHSKFSIGIDVYTSNSTGYDSSEEYFEVVNELQHMINRAGKYNAYWERYDGKLYPGKFIITSGSSPILSSLDSPNTEIVTFYADGIGNEDRSSFGDYKQVTRQSYAKVANPSWEPIDLRTADDLHNFRNNIFHRPTIVHQYGTISADKLWVYLARKSIISNLESIISNLRIDYIRRPQRISLDLNNACELSGNASRRIVDLAAERIKLTTENPSFQQFQQSQQIRENH